VSREGLNRVSFLKVAVCVSTLRNVAPGYWTESELLTLPAVPANLTPLKPPLKWAGGKRWLVPHLLPFWQANSHRRLVEPFVGGLAVTLGLQPHRALLNDINPHLISFYRWLQRGLHLTIEMRNDEALYYRQRARFNELITSGLRQSEESAQLFYFLNRTSYNGLCRFNQRKGTFNVPFGRYKAQCSGACPQVQSSSGPRRQRG
jgi:DNA adenine methylase Dam